MNDTQTTTSDKRGCDCSSILVIFILLLVLDIIPLMRLGIAFEERIRTVSVGKEIPDMFPVMVTYLDNSGKPYPAIVFYQNLPQYLKKHPNYSFTVQSNQVKQLNKILDNYGYNSGYGVGGFTMYQRGDRQFFKVEGTWDDDQVNIGWYEAAIRSFTPKRHVRYFGPGLVLMYFPIICLVNVVGSFIIVKIIQQKKRL